MVDLRGRARAGAKRARLDQDVLREEVAVAELDVVVAEGAAVEPRPLLQHDYVVSRLGQHPCGHAATGAGADDEDLALGERHLTPSGTGRSSAARSIPARAPDHRR